MACVVFIQEGVAASHGTRWVALVTQDCSEEQPVEVKQTAAEVLVKVTPTLLTSDTLPMGKCIGFLRYLWNKE